MKGLWRIKSNGCNFGMKVNASSGYCVRGWFLFSCLAMFFGLTRQAQAYIDPGVGGMLIQLLLGGIAGIAVIMKLYWERIRDLFKRLTGKPEEIKQSVENEDDDSTPRT